MEALPRLPMLSFDFRPYYPKNAQFSPDLSHFIRQYYQEDPANYADEIQQLEKLRQQAMKVNKDVEGCNLLKRYFCQLYFLQKRFPMMKQTGGTSEITWKDVLTNSNSKKIDCRSEFTVTLFNIGALHTQLGAADDRSTPEGLKLSCTHFQCAAWAFQYLQEITAVNVRSDFEPGFLQFLIPVCLGQAQECIAEKSITDSRKPSISVQVVAQIVEYYSTALNALLLLRQEDALLLLEGGSKNSNGWLNYLKFKKPYYECVTNLFMGTVMEGEEKMGERVAFYELAAEKLKIALLNFRNIDNIIPSYYKGLEEALSLTRDIVEGKRKNAVAENDFIYHTPIPTKDNLPKPTAAPLVKCIGFDLNDPDVSGPDIFSKLISMKVHELSSVYSEEKAQLLRKVSTAVEEKDSELNRIMQSFKLDFLNPSDDPHTLPEELIDKCAAFQAQQNLIEDLDSKMDEMEDAHGEIDNMLNEITRLIEDEEKAEEEFQIVMNTTARSRSIVSTDLKCQANRYIEHLQKTLKSNESLREAINANKSNFKLLTLAPNELKELLQPVSFEYSPQEKPIVDGLKTVVKKVEEMNTQRALLMLQLRDSLRNDDITNQIALSDEDRNSFTAMVQKEISKHNHIVSLIEQNLKAQENILNALTNKYADYAPIRKRISEAWYKRAEQINALIRSTFMFEQLQEKTQEGLEFYSKTEESVRKLLSRVSSACAVQEEERQQIYEKSDKRRPVVKETGARTTMPAVPATPTVPKLKDYLDQRSNRITATLPSTYASMDSSSYPVIAAHRTADNGRSQTYSDPRMGMVATTTVSPYIQPAYPYSSYAGVATCYAASTATGTQYSASTANPSSASACIPSKGVPSYPVYNNYMANVYNMVANKAPLPQSLNPSALTPTSMANPTLVPSTYSSAAANTSSTFASSYAQNQQTTGTPYAYNYPTYPTSEVTVGHNGTSMPPTYPATQASAAYNGAIMPNYTTGYYNTSVGVNSGTSMGASQIASSNSVGSSTVPSATASHGNFSTDAAVYNTNASNVNTDYNMTGNMNARLSYGITSTNMTARSTSDNYNYAGIKGFSTSATGVNYPNASNYPYANNYTNYNAIYQNMAGAQKSAVSHQPQNQQIPPSTTVNYVSISGMTYNSAANYTSAGRHATENIESFSKSHDGRSYAAQYSLSDTVPAAVDANSHPYYTAQYGGAHQYPSSKANDPSKRQTNDRDSTTYMQAVSNQNTSTSTNANVANTSTVTIQKPESNLDLLADLDFNVSDTPLVPTSSCVPSNQTTQSSGTEVDDELAKLSLEMNGTNVCEKKSKYEENSNWHRSTKNALPKDVFESSEYRLRLNVEAEKLDKFVDKLEVKTLNGSTALDNLWSEYVSQQERFFRSRSTSEGQKYGNENRSGDDLPYNHSRVILANQSKDYINASFLRIPNASAPDLIVTQAPTISTVAEFWLMIWQQEVELVVCLLSDSEMDKDEIYWPKEKKERLVINDIVITLISSNSQASRIERILSISVNDTSRIVTHLQICTQWNTNKILPELSADISQLVDESVSFYFDQHNLHHPIVVHADLASGRAGVFVALLTFYCDILGGIGIPELMTVFMLLSDARKNLLDNKECLRCAFHLALDCVHYLLSKKGISVASSSAGSVVTNDIVTVSDGSTKIESEKSMSHSRSSSLNGEMKKNDLSTVSDPFSSIDPLWSIRKKSN